MNRSEDIARIKKYFRERAEVSALYLFGSFGRERATKESDIAVLIGCNNSDEE